MDPFLSLDLSFLNCKIKGVKGPLQALPTTMFCDFMSKGVLHEAAELCPSDSCTCLPSSAITCSQTSDSLGHAHLCNFPTLCLFQGYSRIPAHLLLHLPHSPPAPKSIHTHARALPGSLLHLSCWNGLPSQFTFCDHSYLCSHISSPVSHSFLREGNHLVAMHSVSSSDGTQ